MKKIYLVVLLLVAAVLCAAAQQPGGSTPPVRWRTAVRMTGENSGEVTFRALISQGWHLYGLELPQGGPRPTKFNLTESTGVTFTGPVRPARAPLSVDDPMFGMTLTWWDANVAFTVPFTVTDRAASRIKASISYMVCDGTTCMPPKTENIAAPLPK